MKKSELLRVCNRTLLILLPFVLASSIVLEINSSKGYYPVIFHIAVCFPFMSIILWHIYLHFKWEKWLTKFSRQKIVTRILWWLYLLTFATGIATLIHWLIVHTHSPLGGIHGKIGFLMIILALGHLLKRLKYFKQ